MGHIAFMPIMKAYMSNVNSPAIVIPSFNGAGASIVAGYRKFDKASVALIGTLGQAFQKYLDACSVAGIPREAKSVKNMGDEMRECQVMLDAKAMGYVDKTFTEYVQGAMRAYFHNVPWGPTLKNNPAYKIPGKDGVVKAGKVTSTSVKDLHKTLSKAIGQARLLGMDEQAADLLDFLMDNFDGFMETVAE